MLAISRKPVRRQLSRSRSKDTKAPTRKAPTGSAAPKDTTSAHRGGDSKDTKAPLGSTAPEVAPRKAAQPRRRAYLGCPVALFDYLTKVYSTPRMGGVGGRPVWAAPMGEVEPCERGSRTSVIDGGPRRAAVGAAGRDGGADCALRRLGGACHEPPSASGEPRSAPRKVSQRAQKAFSGPRNCACATSDWAAKQAFLAEF
jgi:hypothetical protein